MDVKIQISKWKYIVRNYKATHTDDFQKGTDTKIMKTITQKLTEICSEAFEKCGYNAQLGIVTRSDRPELCQFQCNGALKGAKLHRVAPIKIAAAVVEELKKNDAFEDIQAVAPGFINIILKDAWLASFINELNQDKARGVEQVLSGKKVLIDYGGPNVAKPLHIGHLRSAIIGESLKRIAAATGADAFGDIHLGDWGLQMGLVITELKERHPDWKCFDESFDPEKDEIPEISIEELNEVYPCASKKSKEDEQYSKTAHEITALLQKKHPGYYALWKSFMKISKADMKRIYDRLNVSFEYWYGESDAEEYVEELISLLEEKQLLVESDGARVVIVEEESDTSPMPPVIIKKSDNSNIYATTDLATLLQRKKLFNPDNIWYVVDKRQGLHFSQVFRCQKKAGILGDGCDCEHLGFGTMNGADGKPFKTRDGGVMQLTALLDFASEKSRANLDDSKFETEEERRDAADKIAMASVKFGDLINNRTKDYVFDIDRFLSCEGKTGAYLLYTITRITSLLGKLEGDIPEKLNEKVSLTDTEKALLLTLADSAESVGFAAIEKAPNYVAESAYQISAAFSAFYHQNRVLGENDVDIRNNRLALCAITKAQLEFLTSLLGIDTVSAM